MCRYITFTALCFIVLSTTLLLRAQFLPQPTPPGVPAPTDDPFGTPATPAADPFAPAPVAADPFAPAAPAVDPFGAPVPPAQPALPALPALPVPAPAKPMDRVTIPLHVYTEYAASSFVVNLYNHARACVPVPPSNLIIFADESLAKETIKKMTPAERMAYHLDRPATINCYDDKLVDLVVALTQQFQVNVEIDRKSLEEAAFDTATPINWQMTRPANLGGSLRRMLHSLSLDYLRLEDTFQITTRHAFESKLFTKTYNLDREMFRPRTACNDVFPGDDDEGFGLRFCGFVSGLESPRHAGDDDFLVDVIQLIQPMTWKANGGQGDLHLDLAKSLLVVSQRQDVHDEIEIMLADLRKAARSNQQATQANAQLLRRVVFRLKLPEKQAGPAQPLGDGLPGKYIPLEPAYTMKEVADLIKQQVEPHTWKDDKHSISILGECLIINQSEAVQTKIYQFLHALGITREQFDENNRPFYGFS